MNQWRSIDSKLSLDGKCANRDHGSMIIQAYHLYVERIDRTKNMARFYAMSIEPNLFGEACLTRRWGRIGTNGQTISHHFATEREAVNLFLDLLRRKKGRGYSTVARDNDIARRELV
ncbi:WGR domain-containing protein [Rhizobium sp. AQ_MP]|nr:WGR domain-containing protein [Rhizobium sp. AQ_MP]MBC2774917.1 WGR domain-containing protein [Rhizobium sp. AQ_MP]